MALENVFGTWLRWWIGCACPRSLHLGEHMPWCYPQTDSVCELFAPIQGLRLTKGDNVVVASHSAHFYLGVT